MQDPIFFQTNNQISILQKQLIDLKTFNYYTTEINFILNTLENISELTLDQINNCDRNIKSFFKTVTENQTLVLYFKRQLIEILKNTLNLLVKISVLKIINNIKDF